jgi:hypothetical protein
MREDKIHYRDLSAPLKIAIVASWIFGSIYLLLVLVGFIQAALGL